MNSTGLARGGRRDGADANASRWRGYSVPARSSRLDRQASTSSPGLGSSSRLNARLDLLQNFAHSCHF